MTYALAKAVSPYLRRKAMLPQTWKRLVGLLFASALWAAGLGPALAGEADDAALVLTARTALARDKSLVPLNLGVCVEDGLATLFGAVPAVDLGKRAEDIVRAVPGIRGVASEIHVLAPDDPIVEKMARSNRISQADRTVPAPIVLVPVPGTPSPQTPALNERVAAKPAPVAVTLRDPTTDAGADASVADAVKALQRREAQWHDVKIATQGGIVHLSGSVRNWSELWSFADAISRLSGVERVVIDRIESP
jgi:osmotically-inducible protein OsmY